MRILLVFLVLLSIPLTSGQSQTTKCLVEGEVGQVVGRVVNAGFFHSIRGTTICGDKLVLLKPRCLDYIDSNDGKGRRIEITELQIFWMTDFSDNTAGEIIKITGRFDNYPINVVARPQIWVIAM